MRTVTLSACLLGLCLAAVACTNGSEEPGDAPSGASVEEPSAEPGSIGDEGESAAPGEANDDAGAAAPAEEGDAAATPADGADASADAGADASDSGAKQSIPMPTMGKLHAVASSGQSCAWTVDGVGKGTSTALDVALWVGSHAVSCKRASDGYVASKTVDIVANLTTSESFYLPVPNGTLVAVAVGGSCAFTVNGASKGTTSQLTLSVPPGVYSVGCKPSPGAATISKSALVKSGETAMAMFDLR